MHVVIIHYLYANRQIQQMLIITYQLQLPQLSPRYLIGSCCRDSPGTCGRQTAKLVSSKHMGQKLPYLQSSKQYIFIYHNQDTPVHMCFFDAQKAFDRGNRWTLANKLLDRNVQLHIVKLPITNLLV